VLLTCISQSGWIVHFSISHLRQVVTAHSCRGSHEKSGLFELDLLLQEVGLLGKTLGVRQLAKNSYHTHPKGQ
jgi:hypothetical protein